jgi:hypothetical protein
VLRVEPDQIDRGRVRAAGPTKERPAREPKEMPRGG